METILSVDPGITGMGAAVWDYHEWHDEGLHFPVKTFVIPEPTVGRMSSEEKKFMRKTWIMLDTLEPFIQSATFVVTEWPEHYETAIGHAAAVDGKIVKLAWFVGALSMVCHRHQCEVRIVKPSEWKGQRSKEQVIRKIIDILPGIADTEEPPKTHAWDAIGLGLYCQGKFKRK